MAIKMKVNEPIIYLDQFDEINNKTEKIRISFSEIYSIEKIEKTNVSMKKDILHYLNLKNGKNYPISKKLYKLVNDLIINNPNLIKE